MVEVSAVAPEYSNGYKCRDRQARVKRARVRNRINVSGWGAMMRKRYDDDEQRPFGFWRFVRGVIFALLVSAGAVAVLSIYGLAPPKPPSEPEVVEEKT